MRKAEPNTRALRDEALDVQLACQASCICSRVAPQSRPCIATQAAEMIGRLLATLQEEAKQHSETVSA